MPENNPQPGEVWYQWEWDAPHEVRVVEPVAGHMIMHRNRDMEDPRMVPLEDFLRDYQWADLRPGAVWMSTVEVEYRQILELRRLRFLRTRGLDEMVSDDTVDDFLHRFEPMYLMVPLEGDMMQHAARIARHQADLARQRMDQQMARAQMTQATREQVLMRRRMVTLVATAADLWTMHGAQADAEIQELRRHLPLQELILFDTLWRQHQQRLPGHGALNGRILENRRMIEERRQQQEDAALFSALDNIAANGFGSTTTPDLPPLTQEMLDQMGPGTPDIFANMGEGTTGHPLTAQRNAMMHRVTTAVDTALSLRRLHGNEADTQIQFLRNHMAGDELRMFDVMLQQRLETVDSIAVGSSQRLRDTLRQLRESKDLDEADSPPPTSWERLLREK